MDGEDAENAEMRGEEGRDPEMRLAITTEITI